MSHLGPLAVDVELARAERGRDGCHPDAVRSALLVPTRDPEAATHHRMCPRCGLVGHLVSTTTRVGARKDEGLREGVRAVLELDVDIVLHGGELRSDGVPHGIEAGVRGGLRARSRALAARAHVDHRGCSSSWPRPLFRWSRAAGSVSRASAPRAATTGPNLRRGMENGSATGVRTLTWRPLSGSARRSSTPTCPVPRRGCFQAGTRRGVTEGDRGCSGPSGRRRRQWPDRRGADCDCAHVDAASERRDPCRGSPPG